MLNTVLVIAFKFNDIYYASSTKDFKSADRKVLIVFSECVPLTDFPLKEIFDRVHYFKIKGNTFNQMAVSLLALKRISAEKPFSSVILSNPFILLTQILLLFLKNCSITLIEDGAMNYYRFMKTRGGVKKVRDFLLKKIGFFSRINETYLTNPSIAKTFFGEPVQLELGDNIGDFSREIINILNNKKILVGGGFIELLSEDERQRIINQIMARFKIDYFIPHHTSLQFSESGKYINISNYSITLEMLFRYIDKCEIYSFGSSTLISGNQINGKICTNYLRIKKIPPNFLELDEVLKKTSNFFFDV